VRFIEIKEGKKEKKRNVDRLTYETRLLEMVAVFNVELPRFLPMMKQMKPPEITRRIWWRSLKYTDSPEIARRKTVPRTCSQTKMVPLRNRQFTATVLRTCEAKFEQPGGSQDVPFGGKWRGGYAA
jgi:hypothetical protein